MTSQLGQDLFVLNWYGGATGGFFLDSGASDGVNSSNTRLLEAEYSWSGICVEPNEHFFAQLSKSRRCHCVNCCLYDRNGEIDFFESAQTLGGILAEYHPAHLEYALRSVGLPAAASGKVATTVKATRTIGSILTECGAPKIIDYWSLDTEGSELAILKSFPFDDFSFGLLTVEHNWLPIREEIQAFLAERGYSRVANLGIDDCYAPTDRAVASAWKSKAWRRKLAAARV